MQIFSLETRLQSQLMRSLGTKAPSSVIYLNRFLKMNQNFTENKNLFSPKVPISKSTAPPILDLAERNPSWIDRSKLSFIQSNNQTR